MTYSIFCDIYGCSRFGDIGRVADDVWNLDQIAIQCETPILIPNLMIACSDVLFLNCQATPEQTSLADLGCLVRNCGSIHMHYMHCGFFHVTYIISSHKRRGNDCQAPRPIRLKNNNLIRKCTRFFLWSNCHRWMLFIWVQLGEQHAKNSGEHLSFSKTFTAVVARLTSLFGMSMVDCSLFAQSPDSS